MQNVLMVYKEVNLTNESLNKGEVPDVITVSVDRYMIGIEAESLSPC